MTASAPCLFNIIIVISIVGRAATTKATAPSGCAGPRSTRHPTNGLLQLCFSCREPCAATALARTWARRSNGSMRPMDAPSSAPPRRSADGGPGIGGWRGRTHDVAQGYVDSVDDDDADDKPAAARQVVAVPGVGQSPVQSPGRPVSHRIGWRRDAKGGVGGDDDEGGDLHLHTLARGFLRSARPAASLTRCIPSLVRES